MTSAIHAVILAAGSSVRLGRPKALIPLVGTNALARIRDTLVAAGIDRGAVVLGEHADEILAACDTNPFAVVRNPNPKAGRTGSLQRGLDAIAPDADVLLWPVDRPLASAATLRALLAARAEADDATGWIVPTHAGHAGHPLVLCNSVRASIAAAGPDESLRDILQSTALARRETEVPDRGIHANIDTDEDLANALAWWRG